MKTKTLRLKVWGDYALFTRPEMKAERVSYDVITPSAARGVLEAILWKPAIRWVVTQIDVLPHPKHKQGEDYFQWLSVRRNEVKSKASTSNALKAMKRGNGILGLEVEAEDERQQRASLLLKNVAYLIHAHCEFTEKAGPDDTPIKFEQMFERRASKGQCMHRPYLGCREFAADFEWVDPQSLPQIKPIPVNRELGYMLHDLDYRTQPPTPRFFRATLDNGSINKVPDLYTGTHA